MVVTIDLSKRENILSGAPGLQRPLTLRKRYVSLEPPCRHSPPSPLSLSHHISSDSRGAAAESWSHRISQSVLSIRSRALGNDA